MIQIPFKKTVLLFWVLVLTDLLAILPGLIWLHTIAKPLLIPCLVLLIYAANRRVTGKAIIVIGLFFSWLGDVFLLFENRNPLFFIFGLASFFITHLCYIIYFLSTNPTAPSYIKKHPIFILLTLCYGAGLVWVLFPFLGTLKIPVIAYAAVICCMLLCSIHIYLSVPTPNNQYFIAGALLFVLSDSLLAVNKFYQPIPLAGIWIMLSYCAAQYLIVLGLTGLGEKVIRQERIDR